MKKLLVHPTPTAQWVALLHEAQASSNIHLKEDLESYLVFLLMRFTEQPDMVSSVLGLDFLNSVQSNGPQRNQQLRDVGDKCLLMTGLFPKRAEKRRVKLSYFVKLGQTAYLDVSQSELPRHAELFCELSTRFTHLLDVLQATRSLSESQTDLDFWQAMDLWQETGSQSAKATLNEINPNLTLKPTESDH